MKKIIFSLFLYIAVQVDAHACSCLALTTEQKYQQAKQIFIAKVIETKLLSQDKNEEGFSRVEEQVQATLRVKQTIKGRTVESIGILDGVPNGANCSVGLYAGREYLIFLSQSKSISICDGTQLYDEYQDKSLVDALLLQSKSGDK